MNDSRFPLIRRNGRKPPICPVCEIEDSKTVVPACKYGTWGGPMAPELYNLALAESRCIVSQVASSAVQLYLALPLPMHYPFILSMACIIKKAMGTSSISREETGFFPCLLGSTYYRASNSSESNARGSTLIY